MRPQSVLLCVAVTGCTAPPLSFCSQVWYKPLLQLTCVCVMYAYPYVLHLALCQFIHSLFYITATFLCWFPKVVLHCEVSPVQLPNLYSVCLCWYSSTAPIVLHISVVAVCLSGKAEPRKIQCIMFHWDRVLI